MCVNDGDECFPNVGKKENKNPYWNEIVQQ